MNFLVQIVTMLFMMVAELQWQGNKRVANTLALDDPQGHPMYGIPQDITHTHFSSVWCQSLPCVDPNRFLTPTIFKHKHSTRVTLVQSTLVSPALCLLQLLPSYQWCPYTECIVSPWVMPTSAPPIPQWCPLNKVLWVKLDHSSFSSDCTTNMMPAKGVPEPLWLKVAFVSAISQQWTLCEATQDPPVYACFNVSYSTKAALVKTALEPPAHTH